MLAEKSRNTLCLLWRLLKYALPQWRLVILALLATVIYSATQAVPAALTKRLLDDALLKQDTDLLLLLCFIAIGAAVVAGATCFIKEYFRQRVLFRAIVDIRQHAGEYVLTLSMGYFDRKKVGELMSRMTNDIQATRQALDFMTGDIIEAPLTIAAALAVALHNCWQLTLLSLLSLPVFWILVVRFGKRVKKHSSRSLVQLAQVTESMQQMISGVRVVKAFGLEKQKAEEFRRENESFFHKVMRMVFTKALSRSLIEASYMAGVAVLVLAGGYLVISSAWGLTLGGFGTFCGALATMYLPAKKLSRDYNTIQESLAGCERIFAMLDEKPEVEDAPTAEEVKEMRGEIVFEDVWFTYNSGEPALKGISFTVKPGESLAIVGASGSGKSTILNLILRFYDPQKGRILIDGIDIKQIKRRSLLRHLAVVTQEPFLFNTTVLENIGYGRVGATREDIISSAKAAKIHDVITALPQGYDTVVGERGGNLSGGERQRVTIARAILRNPTILLLDEATSNLDSESEKAVQEALAELMKNRTTIMVAHRLSSISGVDRIIVIEDGKIVEEGSHEELMAAGGIYRKMFDLQHYTEEAEARAE